MDGCHTQFPRQLEDATPSNDNIISMTSFCDRSHERVTDRVTTSSANQQGSTIIQKLARALQCSWRAMTRGDSHGKLGMDLEGRTVLHVSSRTLPSTCAVRKYPVPMGAQLRGHPCIRVSPKVATQATPNPKLRKVSGKETRHRLKDSIEKTTTPCCFDIP